MDDELTITEEIAGTLIMSFLGAIVTTVLIFIFVTIFTTIFPKEPTLLERYQKSFPTEIKDIELTGESADNKSYFYIKDDRFVYKDENYVSTNDKETNYVQFLGEITDQNYFSEGKIHSLKGKVRIMNTSFIKKDEYTQYVTEGTISSARLNLGITSRNSADIDVVSKPEKVVIYKNDVVIDEVADDLSIYFIIFKKDGNIMLARTSELITADNESEYEKYILELYNLDRKKVVENYIYSKPEKVTVNNIEKAEKLKEGNQKYSCKETVYMREGKLIDDNQFKDYCILKKEEKKEKDEPKSFIHFITFGLLD